MRTRCRYHYLRFIVDYLIKFHELSVFAEDNLLVAVEPRTAQRVNPQQVTFTIIS